MPDQEEVDPQKAIAVAQLQKLELEIKKLTFDVESFGSRGYQLERILRFIPLITVIIAVAGFWFTVNQYNAQQASRRQTTATSRR
jgi:hypothetical protein